MRATSAVTAVEQSLYCNPARMPVLKVVTDRERDGGNAVVFNAVSYFSSEALPTLLKSLSRGNAEVDIFILGLAWPAMLAESLMVLRIHGRHGNVVLRGSASWERENRSVLEYPHSVGAGSTVGTESSIKQKPQPLRVAAVILVGAGGFEPPTSCSQSGASHKCNILKILQIQDKCLLFLSLPHNKFSDIQRRSARNYAYSCGMCAAKWDCKRQRDMPRHPVVHKSPDALSFFLPLVSICFIILSKSLSNRRSWTTRYFSNSLSA